MPFIMGPSRFLFSGSKPGELFEGKHQGATSATEPCGKSIMGNLQSVLPGMNQVIHDLCHTYPMFYLSQEEGALAAH